jgi:hypothetical protein
MRLDEATAIYAGSEPVLRIMVNGVQVWPVAGGGSANQLRILIEGTYGAEPMVATLQFKAGGTVLTGTPFGSSTGGVGTEAAAAFDADAATYWQPSLDLEEAPFLGLTLDRPAVIDEIVMTYPSIETYYTASSISAFRVQKWDGAWIDLVERGDEAVWTPGETRTYPV